MWPLKSRRPLPGLLSRPGAHCPLRTLLRGGVLGSRVWGKRGNRGPSRRGPAPCRLVAWGPGSARGGGRELGRICLKELADARQRGQLVALHVLGVHAVKQEGAVQVLDERGLRSETQRGSRDFGFSSQTLARPPWAGPCAGHWGRWALCGQQRRGCCPGALALEEGRAGKGTLG